MRNKPNRTNPCPSLAPHVAMTIEALAADGITPTPAEIAWLAKLREPCDNISTGGDLPPIPGSPIEIAGETWWPLHARASSWYRRTYFLFGDEETEWRLWVYMYAHTRSAPGDSSLLLLTARNTIKDVVGQWRAELPLHEEHEIALHRFLRRLDGDVQAVPPVDQPAIQPPPPTPWDGIAQLCRLFPGTTPEYWWAGISERDTDELLRASDRNDWATSRTRLQHIDNYLTAVRWIRRTHGK